jgi:hypothetical protein
MLQFSKAKGIIRSIAWFLYQFPGKLYFWFSKKLGHRFASLIWKVIGNEVVVRPLVWFNQLLGNFDRKRKL